MKQTLSISRTISKHNRLFPLPELTSRPQSQPALCIHHVNHPRLVDRVLRRDLVPRPAALDLIDKPLQLETIVHPPRLTGKAGELATGLPEGVGLVRDRLGPLLDRAAVCLVADDIRVLDVNAVPYDGVRHTVHVRHTRVRLFLSAVESLVGHDNLLMLDLGFGRLPPVLSAQCRRGLADAAVGEAELGIEVGVILIVDAIAKDAGVDVSDTPRAQRRRLCVGMRNCTCPASSCYRPRACS